MKKLILSPNFTIEDIHRIREQNYGQTKDMTVAEKLHITIILVKKQKKRLSGVEH